MLAADHDAALSDLEHAESRDVDEVVDKIPELILPPARKACIRPELCTVSSWQSIHTTSYIHGPGLHHIPLVPDIAAIAIVPAIKADEVVAANLDTLCVRICDV